MKADKEPAMVISMQTGSYDLVGSQGRRKALNNQKEGRLAGRPTSRQAGRQGADGGVGVPGQSQYGFTISRVTPILPTRLTLN